MLRSAALLVACAAAQVSTAPPGMCSAGQNLLCTGKKLASKSTPSHDSCCSLCKATHNCTSWAWDSATKLCTALLACDSTVGSIGGFSGCDEHKLPKPTWPPGQPRALPYPFRNASLSLPERVRWLVSNLTDGEKIGLLATRTGAIPRLAIREYTYYVECNSGAYANGHYPDATRSTCSTLNLTVFPQSPGMAATFNTTLELLKGDVIGRELRAIALAQLSDFGRFLGLSCFSPMINVIRDPMWGRNSEAYSECPLLTGAFANAVIRGMEGEAQRQPGEEKNFIQAFGGCKHYVPYDGDALSHASDFDLFSTYLPGFARCIEGGALNIMCSYPKPMTAGGSTAAGSSSCMNHRILTNLAKRHLKFDGFFISDEGAVTSPHDPLSFQAGTDVYLGAGPSGDDFEGWIAHGDVPKSRLDDAAYRTLMPRFLLGEFDDPDTVPYWDKARGCSVVGAPEHQQLTYEAAAQSLVLLKNLNSTLPLSDSSPPKIALIGPMTNATWMYNRYAYHPRAGTPLLVSLEKALGQRIGEQYVSSTTGCTDAQSTTACGAIDSTAVHSTISAAEVLVFCVGTGEKIESEVVHPPHGPSLKLPGQQEALLQMGIASGKPVIVLIFTTSPKNGAWMNKAHVVINAGYPQNGGAAAIADTLLGRISPSGRLPITWPVVWKCSISADKGHPGTDDVSCPVQPARLLGSNLTYRFGTHDASNTLFSFGYGAHM